jgi:DNA-binding PadR family transcriptional regulator
LRHAEYYVEPKRLAKLGYLEARREPGKTRERTVYTLTEKGLEALLQYAKTPVRFTPSRAIRFYGYCSVTSPGSRSPAPAW